eukprot:CAMPEP_0198681868 /NCGR_PEP_ID=MMETSP1468-20131203/7673_1 /TAXON_ID=1461545 /ORGANISM="Mantoniella sp, Strain CCMP1436" /LENGTH=72 /DNA_ID=CAMNT_0044424175 /DNA_START=1078 /DNA_END=1293 /DNA_ORIENTATION=-
MNIKVVYNTQPPSKIQINAEIPHVTSTSSMNITEDGIERTYTMCPTTYRIAFLPLVETYPLNGREISPAACR